MAPFLMHMFVRKRAMVQKQDTQWRSKVGHALLCAHQHTFTVI